MKTITIHSLQAILPMMLLSGILLSAEPKVGERELSLHVFDPAGQEPTAKCPAIVFFHEGAWQIGEPNQFYYHADYLANRGMSEASAEYRLTGVEKVIATSTERAGSATRRFTIDRPLARISP